MGGFFLLDIVFFLSAGGCCGSDEKVYRVGGWAWAWWLVTDIQR